MTYEINKKALERNLITFSKYGTIYYPLKANSDMGVLRLISKLAYRTSGLGSTNGFGFLINTTPQLGKLKSLGIGMNNITHINTITDTDGLNQLYRQGVRSFVFDNADKLEGFIRGKGDIGLRELEITIKVAPNGVVVNTGAYGNELNNLISTVNRYELKHGYSIYLNKQARKIGCNADRLIEYSRRDGNVSFLSIGGIHNLESSDTKEMLSKLGSEANGLRVEPGELLMNRVVDCRAKILNINRSNNNIVITIEGSVYDRYFDLVGLGRIFNISNIGHEEVGEYKPNIVHIFGDSGDSNDYIGEFHINNPYDLTVGDTVTIKNMGYYFGRQ